MKRDYLRYFIRFSFVNLLFFLNSCGKYLPPLPPEYLAPSAVKNLQVTADVQNIVFNWESPDTNQKGEDLKSIEGYRIYRKELVKQSDLINDEIQYQLITTINDTHLEVLDKLKKEALEANLPTRKIKVGDELKKFTYIETNLTPGKIYAYQITPINQDGTEGEVNKIVKVLFRGTSSEINLLDQVKLDTDEVEEFEPVE